MSSPPAPPAAGTRRGASTPSSNDADASDASALAAILHALPDAVFRHDREGRVLFVNDAVLAATGFPPSYYFEQRGASIDANPAVAEQFEAARHAVFATGKPATFVVRRAASAVPGGSGAVRWIEYRVVPELGVDGAIDTTLAIGRDVTDREAAAVALDAERRRLVEAQRIARMGAWSWDLRSGESYVSEEVARILGDADGANPEVRADPLGAFMAQLVPEERERLRVRLHEVATKRIAKGESVWRLRGRDGVMRVVHARTEWRYDDDRRLAGALGTLQDVTELAEAEARIARQQALLEESQRIANVGSWEWELSTGAVHWSAEMYRLTGLPDDGTPMTSERARAMIHVDDRAAVRRADDVSAETGTTEEYEFRLRRADGVTRIILGRTRAVRDARGQVVRVVGTCQDVTERRELEQQVRQAQKMEALGMLAGGVAHDFNNLLSAIIGGTELARMEVPDGSQAARDLDDVRQAATRASQLTRQLLAFSRKQVVRPRVLDLRDAVRDAEPLLRRLLPDEIALDVVRGAEPCVVRADAGQLEQVLMNLVVNARDAILVGNRARRGVVTIEATTLTLGAGDPRLVRQTDVPFPPGTYPALAVHDTGAGMDAATVSRVFEPFFTTKPTGKGTGLGLATVFGIVTQNGGTVTVRSARGAGASFTVLLPPEDAPVDTIAMGSAAPPVGTETVLLVEDEAAVRETATRILERHGYRVIATRHGGDALLAWAEHGRAVDVVLTDLRMPEMDGKTLLERLRAERPSLPFVVMSGYSSGNDTEGVALLGRELFLAKPFTSEMLLVQIRAALDRQASA